MTVFGCIVELPQSDFSVSLWETVVGDVATIANQTTDPLGYYEKR